MITADGTASDRLHRIADILKVPVEAFFGAVEPRRPADAGECQRLWDRLRTDADRDAVLDFMRTVLDEEAG